MKLFIFILSCVMMCGTLTAQKDSSKFVIHDMWLIPGLNVTSLEGTRLETMKGFAKSDGQSLLNDDYSLYSRGYGYRIGTLGFGVSAGISWKFANPKKKWQRRSRFRAMLSYNKSTIAIAGCSSDSVFPNGYYYNGTQPSFQIERHKNNNLSFSYHATVVSSEVSHVISTSQEKFISAYIGYGICFGGAIASYIDAQKLYQEYDKEADGNSTDIRYTNMIRNELQQEKIKAKSGIMVGAVFPMGIQVRLSKKRKILSHFNLGLETQPKLSYFFINKEPVSAWQLHLPLIPSIRYQFH